MGLETATYIDDLNSANPTASDNVSQGDDHIRLLKSTIQATFPNIDGAMTMTQAELNAVAEVPTNAGPTAGSGTAVDFTSIPSWVKRVTISLEGVSTNGTDSWIVQIGDSGGIEATGYLGSANGITTGLTSVANFTTGFGILSSAAVNVIHGSITLTLVDAATNTWVASGVLAFSSAAATVSTAGSKALTATLDRVRLTTTSGTDTFDAGNISIRYEK